MKALKILGCVAVVAMVVSGAAAQMLDDFEGGTTVFSAGTIMADPENPANNALYLAGGEVATLDLPGGPSSDTIVSMRVYDLGKTMHDIPEGTSPGTGYGWNVGVSGTYNWGVTLLQKSWLNSNQGYGWTGTALDYPNYPTQIWSAAYFGGPRQVTSLATVGTGTAAAPEIPGVGAWSTWTFTMAPDGTMTVANDGITNPKVSDPIETAISSIFLVGGRTASEILAGVYIDDVQILTPQTLIPGDADGDGTVAIPDFVILKNNFGASPATWDQGDFDGDGTVAIPDFVILKNNFGATAVPEPATMSLLALGGLALLRRRSR